MLSTAAMAAAPPSGDHPARLAAALQAELRTARTVFAPPGHKRLASLVAGTGLEHDLTLLAGVEGLAETGNLLHEAECAAARCWGADLARFSVGGSSFANHVALLAVAPSGSKVVVSRLAHKSVLAGLVLGGQHPAWVMPEGPYRNLLVGSVPDSAVADAVRSNGPDIGAVVLTEPTYAGRLCGIRETVAAAHKLGVPVIVDQAWGAHFGFHPALPQAALQQGADIVIVSVHKTLSAASQGALLLARQSDRVSCALLDATFSLLATTSPLSIIQASLDQARELVERDADRLFTTMLQSLGEFRRELNEVPGISVAPVSPAWDPAKVVIELVDGQDGLWVAEQLRRRGYQVAAADSTRLILVATFADKPESFHGFVGALRAATHETGAEQTRRPMGVGDMPLPVPKIAMSPRDAFLSPSCTVGLDDCNGEIASEAIAPYPPGVPLVMPGEVISAQIISQLHAAAASGVHITGASDPSLATLRMVRQP